MTIMASESEIRTAIENIRSSPGTFQRLAEDFMCIKYGGEYFGLRPQGRKANDQTIKGYPDAYARLPDGRFLIVEITVGNWRNHLEEDIEKLKKLGQNAVAEIAFFTMQDSDLLIAQSNANKNKQLRSESHYRLELQKLGIPNEGIRFYFMNQIVRELRQTQYAKILHTLGLPVSVTPFENIDRLPYTEMEPSLTEYRTKDIVYKRRLTKISRSVKNNTVSVITGPSGVGKTTLALAFAHRWAAKKNRTAMYMDFRDSPDAYTLVSSIIKLVRVFGDSNTLFIIDNTHLLAPRLQAQIESAFHDSENQPKLLLISHFATPAHSTVHGNLIKNAEIPVSLEIPDIEAAYRFICRRISRSTGFYIPDKTDLKEWIQFAPDMLTFCMALNNEKELIISGMRPNLSSDGARNFINKLYLANCSPEEQQILAVIATLATYEMPTSEMSLPSTSTQNLLMRNLIIKTTTKEGGYFRYKLAHDKLGRLILEALEADPSILLDETLDRDPFQASFWVRQQLDRERKDPALRGVAATVLQKIDSKLWHFSRNFLPSYVQRIASMYEEANVELSFWKELPERLDRYIELNDNFLMGIPGYLSLGTEHPELAHSCWKKLQQANVDNRFAKACQLAPAKSLGTLLAQAEHQGIETLTWVVQAMTSPAIASAMARRLSTIDPHPAENTLSTVSRVAPELFALLQKEMRKGELLLPFLQNLRRSSDASIEQWLQRPILLEMVLQKDSHSSVALSLATKRTRSLRSLINNPVQTRETNKLVEKTINIIFSLENQDKTLRYSAMQLELVMEYFSISRAADCTGFIMGLDERGKLRDTIQNMKPDKLITTWTATCNLKSDNKAYKIIKAIMLELLDKRLNSLHPPQGEMLDKLNVLGAQIGFVKSSQVPLSMVTTA